jgi:hypothetical protein
MFQFLSPEWIEAAREIRARYESELPEVTVAVRVNQVVTEVPFGDGVVHAYIDTTAGQVEFELGQLDEPDAVIHADYEAARALLLDRDVALVMPMMLSGRIMIQGDLMKLLAMQTAVPSTALSEQVAAEIAAITA